METLWQDIRYGIRMLARKPGFTAVAVLTLALGIGANTAIFSVVNAVLLQPFPYKDSDRLVMVWETNLSSGLNLMYADPPGIVDWRERNRSFEDMAIFVSRSFFLSQESEALRVPGVRVSANLFDLLGVAPLHGRVFTPEEDQPGAGNVVLLSYALWQNRFGGDPAVVGRTFTINEAAYLVTGVMPEGFDFPPPIALEGDALPETPDLWAPLAYNLQASNRGAHHLTVIARLKNSVSIAQAETEMQGIARQMEKEFSGANRGWSIDLVPLREQVVGDSSPALLTLLAAVGLVLLIGCVNIANLLAARNAGRQKEFAIRSALGASRLRVARQLMVESLVLALLGGVAGVLLALWGLDLLVSVAPGNVPRLSAAQIDSSVLGFAAFLSLLTGLLFGLAPALQTAASDLFATLKEGGRTGAQGERVRLQSALVVAEVALSLLLLVGAGLFLQSFLYLQGIDPGFEADKVLTMRVRLPQTRYPGAEERAAGFRQFEE